ncbi:winged helix-turn-helix transcriptional regulator [Candidatus Woesearchaeota archaeon]|nr:winged helix-turn-helix transcriptional regulator [Candidatus Woesearchaeota archaeon]MBW3016174.1 winged helix-turn-helix transcriptional regulator [Candidatus Woesearchaeota archaeon]
MFVRRITIVNIRKPQRVSVNEELQWFGHALGLFGERDRDKSCFRIFIELIKAIKAAGGLTSDELAIKLGLSRATVIHHLNTLMERGIVQHEGNKYVIRAEKLTLLIDDLHRDMERTMIEMKKAAQELDRLLQL